MRNAPPGRWGWPARSLAGCAGACVRLADDGLGRPAIRFFPHRTDADDLPEAFLPVGMAALPAARVG